MIVAGASMTALMEEVEAGFVAANRSLGDVVRTLADAALDSGGSADLYWRLAAEQARSLFDCDAVVCFERLPGDRAVVRAALGAATMLTSLPIPIAPDSQAAFIYRTGIPVVVPNLLDEPRFTPGAIMIKQGFQSSVSCRIGDGDDPIGIVGVFSCDLNNYDDEDAATLHVLASSLDVGLMHMRRTQELEHRAYTDELTGIANRASIIKELETSLRKRPADRFGFLLMVDLDGFKGVNDTLGHEIGDAVLSQVARRITEAVGPENVVGRLGGDEFLVLARERAEQDVLQVAEKTIGLIERVMLIGATTIEISASIGMVSLGASASATDYLRNADRAMYSAKAGGRGRVEVCAVVDDGSRVDALDSKSPAVASGMDLAAVEAAIESITVQLQPIVEAKSHRIVAMSALARGPVGSPLELPERLFAVAETFGRLATLELAAKRAAFATKLPDKCALFVKIDPAVMVDSEAIGQIIEAWQQSGIANRIVVELSARSMTGAPGRLLKSIERCRAIGWTIALDDVGSRSESLTALRIARPEIVKLDPVLVSCSGQPAIGPTMAALADYARHHSVRIIAKGVETAEHEAASGLLGVQLLQGFRFGSPGEVSVSPALPLSALMEGGAGDWWREPVQNNAARVATKSQLVGLSRYLESCATGSDSIVLAVLQRAGNYTARTKRQYAALARRFSVVGVVGSGMPNGIVDGVKQGALPGGSALEQCWQVIVLSSTTCVALLAEEIGGDQPADEAGSAGNCRQTMPVDWRTPSDTKFRFRITSRPSEVEAAARTVMALL